MTEPPVSEPSAHGARPAATAAAEPPDEPPGTRSGSHGFRVGPKPSSPWTSPSRTRPCSSCRAAAGPAVLAAGRDGGVEDRDVALEDLRAGGRLDPARRDQVLERDRHALAVGLVDRAQVRVQLAVALADRVEVGAVELGAETSPRSSSPVASSAVRRSVSIMRPPSQFPPGGRSFPAAARARRRGPRGGGRRAAP